MAFSVKTKRKYHWILVPAKFFDHGEKTILTSNARIIPEKNKQFHSNLPTLPNRTSTITVANKYTTGRRTTTKVGRGGRGLSPPECRRANDPGGTGN